MCATMPPHREGEWYKTRYPVRCPVVGSYDEVASSFKFMSDCGLDGIAIGLVNYIDDMLAVKDEVLPRMERLGLRG